MRSFDSLSEREILSLAVALEEEDERIYGDFADGLRENYPATADMFEEMRKEESGHRRRLIELHQARFGDHLPLIRRQDVKAAPKRWGATSSLPARATPRMKPTAASSSCRLCNLASPA